MENKLSNPNPYEVLEVSPSASPAEITKAFTLAMKKRRYSADIIAKARKTLMNPEERLLADYFSPILPTIQPLNRVDFSQLKHPPESIEFLGEFDDLQELMKDHKKNRDIDQKLGLALFKKSS